MSAAPAPDCFIGWDVGGWNCDRNGKSRDAIVVLDADRRRIGHPWRGNLRQVLNEAGSTAALLARVFALIGADIEVPRHAVMAIDTPLGFSAAFRELVNGGPAVDAIGESATNPYLYRETELFLFRRGLAPLSAVKDMIGSQATKGIHALAKFDPVQAECGVWTDGVQLTAIEAYPAACKASATMARLHADHDRADYRHDDHWDALTCALIGWLFANRRDVLEAPHDAVPPGEGWIWVPSDGLTGAC